MAGANWAQFTYARLGGAEEAFIAIAPDLELDRRMIRVSRPAPLAQRFALRGIALHPFADAVHRHFLFVDDALVDQPAPDEAAHPPHLDGSVQTIELGLAGSPVHAGSVAANGKAPVDIS